MSASSSIICLRPWRMLRSVALPASCSCRLASGRDVLALNVGLGVHHYCDLPLVRFSRFARLGVTFVRVLIDLL